MGFGSLPLFELISGEERDRYGDENRRPDSDPVSAAFALVDLGAGIPEGKSSIHREDLTWPSEQCVKTR